MIAALALAASLFTGELVTAVVDEPKPMPQDAPLLAPMNRGTLELPNHPGEFFEATGGYWMNDAAYLKLGGILKGFEQRVAVADAQLAGATEEIAVLREQADRADELEAGNNALKAEVDRLAAEFRPSAWLMVGIVAASLGIGALLTVAATR